MTDSKLRAWWAHCQGLDGTLLGKSPAEVLEQTGWARSVGGSGPYLTLFSRAGIGRERVDQAVARAEIHELPSARGCTYVVPASDFALALKVGQDFGFEPDMRIARKLGVTDDEIAQLCEILLAALEEGPQEPDELRKSAGGAVRNLGEEGKKKGLTTTLPLALGKLQSAGDIRRLPMNGRLDQQRYRYTLWRPNPLADSTMSTDKAFVELARRFFDWIAPASVAEFQWFSGLGARAAKAAIEPLDLQPFQEGDARLIPRAKREQFSSFDPPQKQRCVLVSCLDGILHLRRDVRGLLRPQDLKRSVFTERGMTEIGELSDLSHHAILDRGTLVGLWDFDPITGAVAWKSFMGKDRALEETVKQTEEFVRQQLGDARAFSLDSPKSRVSRIHALTTDH